MRFRMLGPLEVHTGQEWTSIRAAKWRAVLARLLLSAGQVVATDTLIDELWGDDPPATATNLVSLYMLRLGRFMGDTDGQVIRTRSPGYQLLIGPDDLDVQRFTVLSGQGRKALGDGDPEAAARGLAGALALWRGGARAAVPPSPYVEAEAERLDELRLSATELQLEAEIACGRHREVIPELRRLLADQPLREEWWLLLVRALGCAGTRSRTARPARPAPRHGRRGCPRLRPPSRAPAGTPKRPPARRTRPMPRPGWPRPSWGGRTCRRGRSRSARSRPTRPP